MFRAGRAAQESTRKYIVEAIVKGTPLDYGPFIFALKTDYGVDVEAQGHGDAIRSTLNKANVLDLTV